jgi:hypothetical protein
MAESVTYTRRNHRPGAGLTSTGDQEGCAAALANPAQALQFRKASKLWRSAE